MAASISGPIEVTAGANEPFRGANEQPVAGPGLPPPVLIPFGYVEEEYFLSGEVDGRPYSTSLLVRKPGDASRFSGHVAVETIHAAGAIPYWGSGREVWMRGGHGWVAVASQRSALEGHVKRANPTRYASLDIPDSGEPDNPMAGMTANKQDEISQAILTQIGALLKGNPQNGPFNGMEVQYLTLGGSSQTGGTTLRYIQQSHAHARMPDGKAIYDGYLPMEAFPTTPLPRVDAAIMHPVTEGDIDVFSSFGAYALRDDSEEPDDRYRHYQLAGAPHVVTRGVTDPVAVFSTLADSIRPGETLSQFPNAEFFTAFVSNFVAWVMQDVTPPTAPRIEMAKGEIVRDEFGNAVGGLRSPYVDTPTVRYIASAPTAEGENFFRRLIGLQEPIPQDRLRARYGSRADYLQRFGEGIDRLTVDHWLQPADAQRLKEQEAQTASI